MSEICYGHSSPNAVILPNYGPCNPQAGSISLCCEVGQTCLTNGLCVTQSGVYYNGGCTDSTYKAGICPTFCTSGDANWVVECHGSAVKDGDFCCSVNGTTTTCCNTASNGLGLVAAVSLAQAVSATSVGASIIPASISATVPTSISISVNTSSFGSIASSSTSTSSPIAPTDSPNQPSSPVARKGGSADYYIAVIIPVVLFLILLLACVWWFKPQLQRLQQRLRQRLQQRLQRLQQRIQQRLQQRLQRRHRPSGNDNELGDFSRRREGSDKSGSQAQPTERGVIPAEAEGSQAGGELEGSPVGPVEMDASQTRDAPTNSPPDGTAAPAVAPDNNPPPYGTAAPDVAPDNNPLREPSATPGSWHDPNLGNP